MKYIETNCEVNQNMEENNSSNLKNFEESEDKGNKVIKRKIS